MERIELSKENIKTRWIATFLFLALGLASLAIGLYFSLTPETGWKEILANSSGAETCANAFVLMYNLGAGDKSASAEEKALEAIYAEAAETSYRLFHSSEEFEGIQNISYINSHPNEVISVDPALYEAFVLLNRYGIRSQYLGPAYEIYNGIFNCREDYQTVDYDPWQNPDLRDLFSEIAAYAADADAVELELLGDNCVQLKVSPAYLRFAEENETTRFLDFYWMKNAFIADFIAKQLTDNGYTLGVLSSYDGFVRNLDVSGNTDFEFMLFDQQQQTVYPAAVMQYNGPLNLVYLRSYPVASQDLRHFYALESGEVRGPYLDIQDGLPRTSIGGLASYSKTAGCAEILLRIMPGYVGERFPEQDITALIEDGIESVWCQDGVLCHTSGTLNLTDLHPEETVVRVTE